MGALPQLGKRKDDGTRQPEAEFSRRARLSTAATETMYQRAYTAVEV